jgi:hypothetical protein
MIVAETKRFCIPEAESTLNGYFQKVTLIFKHQIHQELPVYIISQCLSYTV